MKPFQLGNQSLKAVERSPTQKSCSINISKGGELWGVRFSSPEAPTIKTRGKDDSIKTPIRIKEEDTNTQAKEEKDMERLNKNPHLRIVSDVTLVLEEDLHGKTIILQKGFTKHSPGRETQKLSQKLGTYNRGPRCINLNKRLQNTLFESTCSRLCAKNSRNKQDKVGTSASRGRDNAEESTYIPDRSYTGGVYKLAIPCGIKDRGQVSIQ